MKKVNKYLSVLALATLVSSTSYSADFAIDVHAGLMGAGVGGTVGINDYLNVRGGFNGADANGDFEEDGLTYQADLELDNQYVMLDLYPFKGKFRFTAGIYNNSNGFGGSATAGPTGATIGEGADEIDVPANSSISLDVAYNDSMSTYVGVGFGNPVSNGGGFGFSVDLGLVATGNLTLKILMCGHCYKLA